MVIEQTIKCFDFVRAISAVAPAVSSCSRQSLKILRRHTTLATNYRPGKRQRFARYNVEFVPTSINTIRAKSKKIRSEQRIISKNCILPEKSNSCFSTTSIIFRNQAALFHARQWIIKLYRDVIFEKLSCDKASR